jgi:hypothetical protein
MLKWLALILLLAAGPAVSEERSFTLNGATYNLDFPLSLQFKERIPLHNFLGEAVVFEDSISNLRIMGPFVLNDVTDRYVAKNVTDLEAYEAILTPKGIDNVRFIMDESFFIHGFCNEDESSCFYFVYVKSYTIYASCDCSNASERREHVELVDHIVAQMR